jgi:hypothetical protein
MANPNPNTSGLIPFKKGQSGNPAGKPRKLPHLEQLLADVLSDEQDGIEAAKAILMKLRQKAVAGDIRAAEVLLDRAYGKPKQDMKHTIEGPLQLTFKPADGCEPITDAKTADTPHDDNSNTVQDGEQPAS